MIDIIFTCAYSTIYFMSISELCLNIIETEAVFTKTDTMYKTLIFFKIVPLAFSTFIPESLL